MSASTVAGFAEGGHVINVYAQNVLIRKYNFSYQYSPVTHRSLLTGITQIGADGVTALPAVTLAYQDNADSTLTVSGAVGATTALMSTRPTSS